VYDSHTHLDFPAFQGRLSEQLEDASSAGVSAWFVPGYELDLPGPEAVWDWQNEATKFSGKILRGVGIHPWTLTDRETSEPGHYERLARRLDASIQRVQAVAVGEVGFDFAREDVASLETQRRTFRICLEAAQSHALPLVIHSVSAEEELRRSLHGVRLPSRPGVVHAFNGSRAFAEWLVGLGFRVGVGTLLVRQLGRDQKTRLMESVRSLPLGSIVLETDSTSPDQPLRDLERVARAVAQVRGESLETVMRVTQANAESSLAAPAPDSL
jgi:TatD DNase family protein